MLSDFFEFVGYAVFLKAMSPYIIHIDYSDVLPCVPLPRAGHSYYKSPPDLFGLYYKIKFR